MEIVIPIIAAIVGLTVGAGGIFAYNKHNENGGKDIQSPSGEILTYQSKQGFGYDFMQIKDILDDIGALEKAVKVNNGFIDRLVSGFSLNEELKNTIKEARQEYSETKSIQVIKKGH